jgi:trans-aconitate methyltransferase
VDASRTPLPEIIAHLQRELGTGAPSLTLDVLDPDAGRGLYAGEHVAHAAQEYVHRPLRVWVDLAERLGLRLLTPRALPQQPDAPALIRLTFERLDRGARLKPSADDPTEKYGAMSAFARISKLEDPGFVIDMAEALARVALPPHARVLDLGVNTGDELALLMQLSPPLRDATLVGIDHSASAIAAARERFAPSANIQLHVADLSNLAQLALGQFDLVLSIGTLQSPGIDDREVIRQIVQHHLAPAGAVIVGFPNCRYIDGEVVYGTRMKNFSQPELGLLIKDVAFYRKYLQQHHRQVFVTGKHYMLVTAVAAADAAT